MKLLTENEGWELSRTATRESQGMARAFELPDGSLVISFMSIGGIVWVHLEAPDDEQN